MADYTHLSTPAEEWTAFERSFSPPTLPSVTSVQQARDQFNNSRVKLFHDVLGTVDGISSLEFCIPTRDSQTVPARIYRACGETRKLPLYIHLHGGGFHLGNLETEDTGCRLISLHTKIAVLNLNYRHSPEWTFPTPVQDVWDALEWISQPCNLGKYNIDENQIVIGGTSAGASLACAATLHDLQNLQQNSNRIKGLVLTIPPTVHESLFPRSLLKDGGCSSLEQNAEAPILPMSRCRAFLDMYKPKAADKYFSPLLVPDEEIRAFPRTCFHVAGMDPLRDEGLLFEEKLKRAGVETRLKVYPGFPHGFMGFPQLEVSSKWRQDLYDDIQWLLKGSNDTKS